MDINLDTGLIEEGASYVFGRGRGDGRAGAAEGALPHHLEVEFGG